MHIRNRLSCQLSVKMTALYVDPNLPVIIKLCINHYSRKNTFKPAGKTNFINATCNKSYNVVWATSAI